MKILILDQHTDATRSLLQQFSALGHECFVADHTLALVPEKYTHEKLTSYEYGYPYSPGNKQDLITGKFDAFLAMNLDAYKHLERHNPKQTKGIFYNVHHINLSYHPDNILSCESRALSSLKYTQHGCLFVLSFPQEKHPYHGPSLTGDYIQLIYGFKKYGQRGRPSPVQIFETGKKQYLGKREIINYGDEIHVKDTDVFPLIYAQPHFKTWGSGNDYAILKGMARGIPPILFKPFIAGSICDNFIDDSDAFLLTVPNNFGEILNKIDNEPETVIEKGKKAREKVLEYMFRPEHLEKLAMFLSRLL